MMTLLIISFIGGVVFLAIAVVGRRYLLDKEAYFCSNGIRPVFGIIQPLYPHTYPEGYGPAPASTGPLSSFRPQEAAGVIDDLVEEKRTVMF